MSKQTRVLKAAFPYTLPIFAGFWFLGLTYGVLMNVSGFSFIYPLLMSMLIYAGSMEFIAVDLLLSPFNPLQALLMTLMVNARHMFYGLSMLGPLKDIKQPKKTYLVFGMCDETFSINYSAKIPDDVDRGDFMFWVTLLNQLYWVSGATLGGISGSFITFNTEGLDFAMTAMFIVIFLDNFLKEDDHTSSLTGLLLAVLALLVFGPDGFIIPAMLLILAALTLLRGRIESKEVAA